MQSVVMSTSKKSKAVGYGMGGQRSGKTDGIITQSIRITVADNNRMHKVAKAEGRSFNSWAAMTLLRETNKVLKRKAKSKLKEVAIG